MVDVAYPRFTTKKAGAGFTLIESLIAFLILSISASIILEQLRVIQIFSERARAQQRYITTALNDASLFYTFEIKTAFVQAEPDKITITPDPTNSDKKVIIKNYAYEGVDTPISRAFSPYQYFDYGGSPNFRLVLLQTGLLPGDGLGNGVRLK